MSLERPTLWRRWRIPAAIVLAATIIWIWQSRVDTRLEQEARQYVGRLVLAAQTRSGEADLLAQSNPIIARQVSSKLRELSADAGAVEIEVQRGDHPQHGDDSATHIALVRQGGRSVLGMRLFHSGDAEGISVLGCWDPTAD
jgi:hypothetical protein